MTDIRRSNGKIAEDRATFDAAMQKQDLLAALNTLAGDIYRGQNTNTPTTAVKKELDDTSRVKRVSQEVQSNFQSKSHGLDEMKFRQSKRVVW
jgi:hypothetical protein